MACRFQLVNATLNVNPTQNKDKFKVFWKISINGFYGHFIDGFLFYLMKI